MTRVHYDGHFCYEVYTLANKSSMFWPTLNCSRPLAYSTATRLVTALVNKSYNKAIVDVIDGVSFYHKGTADVRVRIDDIEGIANESMGKVLEPGEEWCPPYRIKHNVTFYTSSNVSQLIVMQVGFYL